MSEFTEREDAFINGLVDVLIASADVYDAEARFAEATAVNQQQSDAVREETTVASMDAMESYIREAIERSPFDEDSDIAQEALAGIEFGRQLEAALLAAQTDGTVAL